MFVMCASMVNVLAVSSCDCPLRHMGVIPLVCPADSLVPKQLPDVKAVFCLGRFLQGVASCPF